MESNNFRNLYISELQDLYDAEKQLIEALPKMAAASSSSELREGFEIHLEQTQGHVERLEQIFNSLGEDPKRKKCKAMQGLIAEGGEMIDSDFEGPVKDAGLITAAQRVEHYEIAAYGAAKTFARLLGDEDAASLLEQTEDEEKETDEKLSGLADTINALAVESDVSAQESEADFREPEVPKRRAKAAGR
jgi:ferritin-like metal-binding protein YciE